VYFLGDEIGGCRLRNMKTTRIRRPGRLRWLFAFLFCCFIPMAGLVRAQDSSPISALADAGAGAAGDALPTGDSVAPGQTAAKAASGQSTPQAATASTDRDVSERTIFPNFLHDQKDMWLFPVSQLGHGHHWVPTIAVVGVTAGLLALDAHDTPYFRRTTTFNGFNRVFSGNITQTEILVAPASFYVVGLFDKDPYARKTGLLAAEALADVTVLSFVIKGITRQERPVSIPPYGNFSDTFFKAKGNPFSSGFPSGHAIDAFAVATVIARRYGKQHRWVTYVAYGAAGLIGFSRITTQAHFPSEVFLGAALGYAVARFDVLRGPVVAPTP
jgi:membrane-associated phospholipid phosphatase